MSGSPPDGRNIGLRIAFDGSEYNGWQSQPHGRTIENAVRDAIARVEGQDTAIVGASRTDSGVHANGQYVTFFSRHATIPAAQYRAAINAYLPPAISILQSREHPQEFHARYSATSRTYRYHIRVSSRRLVTAPKYAAVVARPPHIAQMNRALAALCGTHDFYSFAKADNSERSTIRTVYQAAAYPCGTLIVIKLQANAFLRTMVRSIVGTILNTELCNAAHIEKMLYNRQRALSGETAPAGGLYLDWIDYEERTE